MIPDLKYPNGMVIDLDFDGTLHDSEHPIEGRKMGPPLPGAFETVKKLADRGFKIRVFTVRDPDHVKEWLSFYQFPVSEGVTNVKHQSCLYVDDKGFHFTHWGDDTYRDICKRLEVDPDL